MTTIDFRTSTFSGTEYKTNGVTITGTNGTGGVGTIVDTPGGGGDLGIAGGRTAFGTELVDGVETIAFSFDNGAATAVSYRLGSGSSPVDGVFGEVTIEAFAANGTSLGTKETSGFGNVNVSGLYNNAPIARFTVKGRNGDGVGFLSLSFTPNQAPTAVNDTLTIAQNTPLSIPVASLVANDTDPENDIRIITSVTNGSNGTVSLSGNTITFTPTPGFNGNASFTYALQDSNGNTATTPGTVNVNVTNSPPIATTDNLTTAQNTPLSIPVSTLLANDSDPENDPFSLTAVSSPTNGTVSLSGSTVSFTPNNGFSGNAGFSYTLQDSQGNTATGTVAIAVGTTGSGTGGRNTINGTAGNDNLSGAGGADTINGLGGNDTLSGNSGGDTLNGGEGDDTLNGNDGADTINGGNGNDTAFGGDLGDTINGDAGSDTLNGDNGADTLNGGADNDSINGGAGDDTISGGSGADSLTGSTGVDTFRLALADSLLANFDRITDFQIGVDRLDGPTAIVPANVAELGAVTGLDETSIAAVLTAGAFGASRAASFSFSGRTFVALNDGTAGFSASSDAIVEITGFTGALTNLRII